ncbi:hypothetical protein N431DRAFT_455337 [Stipitochalara longipes BDJ]|nr:hypothetical protein N431DRAFT_455337 [Stipitochalara longipes BDJ]
MDTQKISDPSEGLNDQGTLQLRIPVANHDGHCGKSGPSNTPNHLDLLQPTASKLSVTVIDSQKKPDQSKNCKEQNPLQTTTSNFSLPIRTVSQQIPQKPPSPSGIQKIPSDDPEQGNKVVTTLVTRYSTRRLGSTTWKCQICNALVESIWIFGVPNSETTSGCESCESRSKMKLCAGCRFTHSGVPELLDGHNLRHWEFSAKTGSKYIERLYAAKLNMSVYFCINVIPLSALLNREQPK